MSDKVEINESTLLKKIDQIRTSTMASIPQSTNGLYHHSVLTTKAVTDKIQENLSIDEFKFIYLSSNLEGRIASIIKANWHTRGIIRHLFVKYPETATDILKNSPLTWLKIHLLDSGFYPSLDYVDNLVFSSNIELKFYAAKRCSSHLLEHLKKDIDYRVRIIAFRRLGVNQCLDEMLSDKAYQVRMEGAIAAPMYYDKFDDMTNELSRKVFYYVAKKIKSKQIPYILGNKNASSKEVKEILAARLTENPIQITME